MDITVDVQLLGNISLMQGIIVFLYDNFDENLNKGRINTNEKREALFLFDLCFKGAKTCVDHNKHKKNGEYYIDSLEELATLSDAINVVKNTQKLMKFLSEIYSEKINLKVVTDNTVGIDILSPYDENIIRKYSYELNITPISNKII